MKHTPGPWEVDLETGEISAGGAILGIVYGAVDYPCCEEDVDKECKANARLIAAAPKLLKVCKAALEKCSFPVRAALVKEQLQIVIKEAEEQADEKR